MLEKNKDLVRTFFNRANKICGTPTDMVTEDFTAHISDAQPYDLQAFEQYQATFYSSFSETETFIEDIIAEGDRVAYRGYVKTVHSGEFMGVPASGKEIVVSVIGFAKIEKGKIAEWWNYPDRLSWMQQIGALPEYRKQ
jgi:steroid delta-isomerase-like uncharacterized protein